MYYLKWKYFYDLVGGLSLSAFYGQVYKKKELAFGVFILLTIEKIISTSGVQRPNKNGAKSKSHMNRKTLKSIL
jgi:hypothetical protein